MAERRQQAPSPRARRAPKDAVTREQPTRLPPRRGATGAMVGGVAAFDALQRLAGNAAVAAMVAGDRRSDGPAVQRDFSEQGETGAGPLASEGPVTQPDVSEGAVAPGDVKPERTNENGDFDGRITTGGTVHAFVNGGQTASAKWLHTGGTGGMGNQSTGDVTAVAPIIKSTPAPPKGGLAKAKVQKGTGKAKVTRSYRGVIPGNNGTAVWAGSGGGLVFVMWSAVARIAKHEVGHVKESKKIHDTEIKPLEKRVKDSKTGATEADAVAALQTHLDWNATLTRFSTADTAMNAPGATFDTTDQAKANFYHDKGKKKIKKVQYDHFVEAP
jgi:hypothetical protein